MKNALTIGFVLAASVGCKKKAAESTDTKGSAMPPADAVAVDAEPVWDGTSTLTLTEGFATPESVLYDPDADIYLVSNINGTPLEADDNGYITKVSPDGKIIEAKWIDGTKDDVKLDAPKGMAIANGLLYVSDINVVRKFDLKTGEPKGEIKVDKATFLNDVANAPDGGIYVTDSGLDAKFASTGTDAVCLHRRRLAWACWLAIRRFRQLRRPFPPRHRRRNRRLFPRRPRRMRPSSAR
jgi:hypothetical protein